MTTGYSISPADTSNSVLDQQMAADVQTYTNACKEYEDVNAQYKSDIAEFNSITDPMAAMIFFIEVCAPDFLSAQEANINVYSTQMNISNDMRAFGTDATNKENTATGITNSDAVAFENDVNDLEKWTNYLDGSTSGSPFDTNASDPYTGTKYLAPVDATNGASIVSDCEAIKSSFYQTNADGTPKKDANGNNISTWDDSSNPQNGNVIASTIQSWFTVPTNSTNIASYEENPNIKATQEAFQEINSSVSTLSSSQQTTFQYYLGNYNQCVSMCNSVAEEEVKGETAMITNQRVQ